MKNITRTKELMVTGALALVTTVVVALVKWVGATILAAF
jgi:hypothetical protein